jgi:hypothetical protein
MTDVNKLQALLSKSKAIMQKSDENYGSPTGNKNVGDGSFTEGIKSVTYEEKEMPNITEDFIRKMKSNPQPQNKPSTIEERYPNLKNSKMPKEVLKAMVENPIDIPENPFVGGSFSAEDFPELIENNQNIMNESYVEVSQPQTNSRNVSREDIKEVIREEFEDMVRDIIEEYFDNSLVTEDIQIKVGETIFSGNLKPLPKKKRRR